MRRLFVERIGERGEALLFFALLDFLYALRLLNPPDPPGQAFTWPQSLLPLWVWAACWGGVGLLCLVSAFIERDSAGFAAAVMLKIGWGLLFLLGWLSGAVDGGYATAVFFLCFARLVFRIAAGIPARPPRVRET